MSTLVITDNGDGTGATATVSGSAGGANAIFIGRVDGQAGAIPFTLSASLTGDGTATLLTSQGGYYFAYLTTDGAVQAHVYFTATDGRDAVATRCRAGIVATLKLLTFPWCKNIYEQLFPDSSNIRFPCALVTVDGVMPSEVSTISTRDDIGRPVKVLIAERADKFQHDKLPEYELWREKAEKLFRSQRVTGVPESVRCVIEPYSVINESDLRAYQHMVTAFTVRVICRENRGLGS